MRSIISRIRYFEHIVMNAANPKMAIYEHYIARYVKRFRNFGGINNDKENQKYDFL